MGTKKENLIKSVNLVKPKIKLTEFKRAVSMLKTDRKSIGLYSKLRVTIAVVGAKRNKNVYMFLIKGKYDFSKSETKVSGIYSYAINLDSIEKAYAFKLKIKKVNK